MSYDVCGGGGKVAWKNNFLLSSAETDKIIHLFVIKKFKKFLHPAFFLASWSPPIAACGDRGRSFSFFFLVWKILKLFVSLWENDKWALLSPPPWSNFFACVCFLLSGAIFSSHLFFLCSEISVPNSTESGKATLVRFLPSNCCVFYPNWLCSGGKQTALFTVPLVFVNKRGKVISI
jgi:hypothetical protein